MTDWNKVVDVLFDHRHTSCTRDCEHDARIDAAIALCRRMALGELVERSVRDEPNLLSPAYIGGPFPNECAGCAPPTETWLERALESAQKDVAAMPEYKQRAGAHEFGFPTCTPATQDEREREHCERAAAAHYELGYSRHNLTNDLIRERAAYRELRDAVADFLYSPDSTERLAKALEKVKDL